MTTAHDAIYARGTRDRDIILVRCNWEGVLHQPDGQPWQTRQFTGSMVSWAADDIRSVLHVSAIPRAEPNSSRRIFPATDLFPRAEARLAPDGLGIIDMSASGGTLAVLHFQRNEGLVLRMFDDDANLLGAFTVHSEALLEQEFRSSEESPFFGLLTRWGKAFVAVNQRLLVVEGGRVSRVEEFSRRICRLAGSAPFAMARIAVSFELGGLVYWPGPFDRGQRREFASDMPRPIAAFNRGGYLIAAHRSGAEVYLPGGDDLVLAKTDAFAMEPIAVLANSAAGQFAIGFESGEIRLYDAS
jgi:hypothetical protein